MLATTAAALAMRSMWYSWAVPPSKLEAAHGQQAEEKSEQAGERNGEQGVIGAHGTPPGLRCLG
jgi:hypothetical protein